MTALPMETDAGKFVRAYIEKARNSLAEAEICKANDAHRACVTRSYYALYHASNAWMKHRNFPGVPGGRPNWRHEDVSSNWTRVLEETSGHGVQWEFDAPSLYNALQGMRVVVDYKARPAPKPRDAEDAFQSAKSAVDRILTVLKKEGY